MRSIEKLSHFRCSKCDKWFSIGDAPEHRQKWFCPWCGNEESHSTAGTQNITQLAHAWARESLRAGDWAIDATCGNGHDTLFLAETVGATGRVAAFDVQESAIAATRARLENAACRHVDFFQTGHENMLTALDATWHQHVAAVFFNLGYLPRSDHSITTHGETTLRALDAARELIAPNGLISLAIYTKHTGGFEESACVNSWLENVPAGVEIRRHGAHNPETPWLVQIRFS